MVEVDPKVWNQWGHDTDMRRIETLILLYTGVFNFIQILAQVSFRKFYFQLRACLYEPAKRDGPLGDISESVMINWKI